MSYKLIDGRKISESIRDEIRTEVAELNKSMVSVKLVVVLVGTDPASEVYVNNKGKACMQVGIEEETYRLPAETTQKELINLIDTLNNDPKVNGILVQSPLPNGLDEKEVFNRIFPSKDVDGFNPVNVGKMVIGEDCLLPCTPAGVQQMLIRSGIETKGKHVVVVGRSNIVGKPMVNIMLQKAIGANSTVTVVHTGTEDIAKYTRQADIIVAAAGRANTITAEMVKEGVVILDVGMNREKDSTKKSGYRLIGDVDFDSVSPMASAITPVPGGVGPMTITMLLANTVKAAKSQK